MPGPPFDTRSPGGAAWANSGRWQVWQDSRPDADRDSSRNNCSPRAATGDRPGVDGAAVATAAPEQAAISAGKTQKFDAQSEGIVVRMIPVHNGGRAVHMR